MFGKSSADDLIKLRDILETPARAMHGDESPAFFDERFQIRPMSGINFFVIRIEEDRVEEIEVGGICESCFRGRDVVEVDGVPSQRFREHREIKITVMLFGIVTDEENADRSIVGTRLRGGACRKKEDAEKA